MVNIKEGKDMEIKMKEKVKVNSFIFKKRVMENTVDLLGRKRNYVVNDIEFMVMIAFINELAENNVILESLYEDDKIIEKITNDIEPLFEAEVLNKPENKQVFDSIVSQLIDYYERETLSRRTLAGILYDIGGELGDMSLDDIAALITQVVNTTRDSGLLNAITNTAPNKTDDEIKNEAQSKIDDVKMRAFIEQFRRTANKAEENKEVKDTE